VTTIYLASASPRRSELLKQINIPHVVLDVPAAPGEDEPRNANESPLEYVQRTALDKAERAISWVKSNSDKLNRNLPILTADTTVALGNQVLGKPRDETDAKEILKSLSGTTHVVYTAVVLSHAGRRWKALSTSKVRFTLLSEEEITAYIASKEPFGKAGAYGIQGLAASFISNLDGSYTGVMGLPLFETAELFKQLVKQS